MGTELPATRSTARTGSAGTYRTGTCARSLSPSRLWSSPRKGDAEEVKKGIERVEELITIFNLQTMVGKENLTSSH